MSEPKVFSLVFPIAGEQVLLGKKKLRNQAEEQLGVGYYSGFGGHLQKGETICENALRELKEESGLIGFPDHLHEIALLTIHNEDHGELLVRVFRLLKWIGEPYETSEAIPCWFDYSQLPWWQMRDSDQCWLTPALNGHFQTVELWIGPNEVLLDCTIKPHFDLA